MHGVHKGQTIPCGAVVNARGWKGCAPGGNADEQVPGGGHGWRAWGGGGKNRLMLANKPTADHGRRRVELFHLLPPTSAPPRRPPFSLWCRDPGPCARWVCVVLFLVLVGGPPTVLATQLRGFPQSVISAPVTPRGTGAPCTHLSHRVPCSNSIVFDSPPPYLPIKLHTTYYC